MRNYIIEIATYLTSKQVKTLRRKVTTKQEKQNCSSLQKNHKLEYEVFSIPS
jgi:hypothetical protein